MSPSLINRNVLNSFRQARGPLLVPGRSKQVKTTVETETRSGATPVARMAWGSSELSADCDSLDGI